ncbi:hypothetical protein N9F21_01890, partial [Porticoccaceae bacterium]|nr:hypothetical protein [Porticoccaceae bacterium]
MPSFKVNSAELVSPSSANSHYGSATTHTSELNHWNGTRPEEIKVLAKGLGAGDLSAADYTERVYEYLWKNINTEFRYGLSKGAFGAMLDQSGTAFDQVHLMVELLREGSVTASYKAGTITLNATQFQDWTGLTDAKAACRFLADGGIPAVVNGSTSASCSYTGNVSSVTLSHIWVSANSKLYDPAYKTHNFSAGIDLASAMNCGTDASATCGSSVTTSALSGATNSTLSGGVSYLQNINETATNSQLNSFAVNLQNHIQTTDRYAEVEEIIGGHTIDIDNMPAAAASLAYPSAVQRTWSGDIPNQYRTTVRVQFDNLDKTLYADEVSGIRLRLLGDPGTHVVNVLNITRKVSLYAEYDVLATSTMSGANGDNDTVTLGLDHPYYAKAAGSAVNGSYMDVSLTQKTFMQLYIDLQNDNVHFFRPLNIMLGLGTTGRGSIRHYQNKQQADDYRIDMANPTDPNHTLSDCHPPGDWNATLRPGYNDGTTEVWTYIACLGPQQSVHNATFLAQNSRTLAMVGQVNKTRTHSHHMLGAATQDGFNIEGSISVISETNQASDERATQFSIAMLSNRLEGSAAEQLYDYWDGFSALSLLTRSNMQAHRLLELNSGNITAGLGHTSGYTTEGQALISSYVADGYTVVLPQVSPIGQINLVAGYIEFFGAALYAYKPNGERIALLAPNEQKGSGGVGDTPSEETLKSTELTDYSQKNTQYYGISDAEGTLTLSPPADIVTGTGNFPYSLPFQRSYSSSTNAFPTLQAVSSPIGTFPFPTYSGGTILRNGWTHNYQISITKGSDGFQGLGEDSALDASHTLAGLYVLRDLHRQTQSLSQQLAGVFTTQWWANNLSNNMAMFANAGSNGTFVRLPNGSFNPPPGSTDKLVQTGVRSEPIANGGSQTTAFTYNNLSFQLTKSSGEVMDFAYGYNANALGQRQFVITDWNFPNGVTVNFSYINCDSVSVSFACLYEVSNNLGRKLTLNNTGALDFDHRHIVSVNDENGRSVDYSGTLYQDTIDHLTTFNVTLPDGGEHRYHYDIVDQPGKTHTSGKITQWYTPEDHTNPFIQIAYDDQGRVESLTSATNNTSNYLVGGLFDEQYRKSETINALGQRTQTTYNENRKPLSSTDPLGNTTVNEYDNAQRLVKTTFPELNAVEYQYDVRHNRTQTRQKAKPSSGLADLVTSATYIEGTSVFTCSNYKTCNKTSTSTDAKGNTTSYSYQSTSGNLLTQTQPSVTGGAPITTIAYNSFGQVTSITDPEGMISLFTYDSLANHSVLTTARIDSANLNLTSTFSY